MKKVERVSIGRYAFTLEEDAGRELGNYIEALKRHYSGNADCDEIVDAFEDRMAELLLERHPGESIITTADIEAIKEQIGAPDTFGDSQSASAEESEVKVNLNRNGNGNEWWKNDNKEKMFRPRNGRIFGGVAAAMAARFNMDITLMRVLWCAAACIGIWLSGEVWDGALPMVCLAYVILWICIPSANQRQEMLNTENEAERNGFWKLVGSFFRILFGGILAVVGICGIAAGVTVFCGINLLDLGGWWMDFAADIVEVFDPEILTALSGVTMKILLGLCYFIPFLVCLYEGIKICFEFKSPKWHPGLILSLVWFISIIAAGIAVAAAFIPTITL